MVRHPIALLTSIALAGCGGASLSPASGDADPTTSRTAQANLLLYPSSEPEALLGRAVHQTGDNVWTIADARAPGCDFPGGTGGLFTSQLLDAIGNARADAEGDGQITLREIADHVGPRVSREARKDNRDQTPTMNVSGDPSHTVVVYGVKVK